MFAGKRKGIEASGALRFLVCGRIPGRPAASRRTGRTGEILIQFLPHHLAHGSRFPNPRQSQRQAAPSGIFALSSCACEPMFRAPCAEDTSMRWHRQAPAVHRLGVTVIPKDARCLDGVAPCIMQSASPAGKAQCQRQNLAAVHPGIWLPMIGKIISASETPARFGASYPKYRRTGL